MTSRLATTVEVVTDAEGHKSLHIDGVEFPHYLAPDGPRVETGGDFTIVHLPLYVSRDGTVAGIPERQPQPVMPVVTTEEMANLRARLDASTNL